MKQIETLVDDIMAMVDTGMTEIKDHDIHELMAEIEFSVRRQLTTSERQEHNTVRMSNVGKPDRQLWYEVNGADAEALTPQTRIKFLYGDIIEAVVVFLAKSAGHTVADQQKEVSINGIKGHIDCTIDGVLVDVKSTSPFAFKKFKDGTLPEDDAFGYIGQIGSYKYAGDYKRAAFLAMDKVAANMVVYEPDSIDLDENADVRVDHVKAMVASDVVPERCFDAKEDGKSGNMKLNVNCSYCKFKHTCWADANDGKGLRTFFYSTGPRFLTDVQLLPKVPEAL